MSTAGTQGLELEDFANSNHNCYSRDSLVLLGAARVTPEDILQVFSRFYFFLPDTAVLLGYTP